jgi:LysM repeat protein
MLFSFAIAVLAASSMPACVDDLASGWSCATVAAGSTMFDMARAAGESPAWMCALNRNNLPDLNCSAIEAGQVLRVPSRNKCVEVPGRWTCHTIQEGERGFDALSTSGVVEPGASPMYLVNSAYIASFNIVEGYQLYEGMVIKIPVYHCHATTLWDCHTVQVGEDLNSIAKLYSIGEADLLLYANLGTVTATETAKVWPGVELKIPRSGGSFGPGAAKCPGDYGPVNCPVPTSPAPLIYAGTAWNRRGCVANSRSTKGPYHELIFYSFCYKIKPKDTLDELAAHFAVPVGLLCAQARALRTVSGNEVTYTAPNCSAIDFADWLSIPVSSPVGSLPLGYSCAGFAQGGSIGGSISGGSELESASICEPGSVCHSTVKDDVFNNEKCYACPCGSLTPCKNLDFDNASRAECMSLELGPDTVWQDHAQPLGGFPDQSAIWKCPDQSILCGDFPTEYPSVTVPLAGGNIENDAS